MRTRNRTIVHDYRPSAGNITIANETHYCSAPSVIGSINVPQPAIELSATTERMDDALGKGKPNPCLHRARKYTVNTAFSPMGGANSGNTWFLWPSGPVQWSQLPERRSRLATQAFDVNQKTGLPTRWTITGSVDESVLLENCLEQARQLQADVLLNIVEANQIYPSIKSLASCLPQMRHNWNKIRKLVKTASGSFLAWKFGVSPILSDVMAIHRYLPKLRKDFRQAYDMKPKKFSSRQELRALFDSTPSNIVTYNGFQCNVDMYQGRLTQAPCVRYVAVVRPTRRYESELFSAFDTAMSRFASSPTSLAWEKVPFSFVLDWFVDLRGVMRAVDRVLGFKPYDIMSLTRSYSYKMTTDVSWRRCNPCNGGTIFDVHCGSVEFSHYERSPVSDKGFAPNWTPRFGKNQAAISAALISQALTKK